MNYEQNSGELDVAEQAPPIPASFEAQCGANILNWDTSSVQRKNQDVSEDAVMLEGDMSVISDNSSEP